MSELKNNIKLYLVSIAVILTGMVFACGTSVAFAEETANVDEDPVQEATADSLAEPGQLLEDYLYNETQEQLRYGNKPISKRTPRYSRLSDYEKEAYDLLKSRFDEISRGDETDTLIRLELGDFMSEEIIETMNVTIDQVDPLFDDEGNLTEEAVEVLLDTYDENFDPIKVINTLLYDCPYELYWFDKTRQYSCFYPSYYFNASNYTEATEVFCDKKSYIMIKLMAADHYRLSTETSEEGIVYDLVDTDLTRTASGVTARVAGIVNDNEDLPDYDKLVKYKDAICDMVSYDSEAAEDPGTPYGDPWQIISVFDDNDETNVVCEGYSKAFKFLCDLSNFESDDVDCYLFEGQFGNIEDGVLEEHMWNTVRMDNQKYYLVDITNCDDGMIGHRDSSDKGDKLFLRGYTYSIEGRDVSEGVIINVSGVSQEGSYSADMAYVYGEKLTMKLYTASERTIFDEDYCRQHDFKDTVTKKATPVKDGEMKKLCSICGMVEPGSKTEAILHPEFDLKPRYYTYNGTKRHPSVIVTDRKGNKIASSTYTVAYGTNVNAGEGNATVTFKGDKYTGSMKVLFDIYKARNPITVKARTGTVKFNSLNKKNQTLAVSKVLTVKKAQGTKTYVKVSGNKKITINKKTGKVTVKKGLKKASYKVKVKVKAAGNKNYKALTKTVTFTVKVK